MSSQQTQYVVNGVTLQSSGTYTYDPSGNLNGGGNGWQYNSNNQLTSAPATTDLPGATGLSYDAAGNLTGLSGKVLTYDCWGHLTRVDNTPAGTVTYAYDSSGRRIRKTASGVTTYYVYDGDVVLAEVDSTGTVTRTYMWGALGLISDHTGAGGNGNHVGSNRTSDDLPLLDTLDPLPGRPGRGRGRALCQAGGSDRYYFYDGQGNTSTLVDGGGNASGQGEYTPYGGTVGTELNTPYAWQGQSGLSHEREPGLYIIGVPDAPPYVPAAPTYTAPYQFHDTNPYQPCNANPASYGPQDEGDDDPFPVDENGRALPYQPMRRGLHQLAGGMKNALNFAAGFNPIYQLGEIATGQDASGAKVSKGQRVLGAAMMAVPFMHNINLLPKRLATPVNVYRIMSSAEAEAVEKAGTFVRSTGRNSFGNSTRVVGEEGLEQIKQYAQIAKDADGNHTYDEIVQIPAHPNWYRSQVGRDGPGGGFAIDLPIFRNYQLGSPVRTPLR